MQGYHVGMPVAPNELLAMLRGCATAGMQAERQPGRSWNLPPGMTGHSPAVALG